MILVVFIGILLMAGLVISLNPSIERDIKAQTGCPCKPKDKNYDSKPHPSMWGI